MLKRAIRIGVWILGLLLMLLAGLMIYVRTVSRIDLPEPPSMAVMSQEVVQGDSGLSVIGNNWFRQSESGLYELYVEGAPFERGVIAGKLTKDLLQYQEKVFTDQINALVPSGLYREGLKYFVGWFNRDLEDYIAEEYKLEIFGLSQASSHDFDDIAMPYQRILNYHAAHDIGHALQNMSLVGCTSFATWGSRSEDSTLIVGRNFDFYVGDEFARNKIVAFYKPDAGYPFMMITFGGMAGVLSGMNTEGLTVTINAAKSDIPSGAATPVSIVAREILQYASTIDEAYAIAEKRKMFVAESFLIGSAKDGRAAIIEKSTTAIARVEPSEEYIISTNHFQSKSLGATQLNQDHINSSASSYRYQRVKELLDKLLENTVQKTVAVLRDQKGLQDTDVGLGNEKAINQLVAHHGIVFQPEKKRVWISTAPWQLGRFVCYDLTKIFGRKISSGHEVYEKELIIPADTFLTTKAYRDFVKLGKFRFPFTPRQGLNPDSVIRWNPNGYHSYVLAGDHYFQAGEYEKAVGVYEKALTKEIATMAEKEHIEKYLQRCREKLK